MSNYWPPRSTPQGFSIEKLAHQYRMRISDKNHSIDNLSKSLNHSYNIHWANRSYDEYREVA